MSRKVYDDLLPEEAEVIIKDQAGTVHTFVLREMTCAEVFSKYVKANQEAGEALRAHPSFTGTLPEQFEEALAHISKTRNDFFTWILGTSEDGLKVNPEWVSANVSHRMRGRLIEIQDELNSTGAAVGNAAALIRNARIKEATDEVVTQGTKKAKNAKLKRVAKKVTPLVTP